MIALFDYSKYNLIMESSFEFKGYDFLYFDEGVPFYTLFRSTRKLNSYWEIKYAGEVLLYLNPDLDKKLFNSLMLNLSDRSSGHVIRTYSKLRIELLCDFLFETKHYNYETMPYVRRYRKLIFNPSRVIPKDEKMSIIGVIIGSRKRNKKITEDKIYASLEGLLNEPTRITYARLGNHLNCTRQTISNNMTSSLKEIMVYHNNHLLS